MPFFIKFIGPVSNKRDGWDTVQRVDKSHTSPNNTYKLQIFTDYKLEIFQKAMLSAHLLNTPVFHPKDNSRIYGNKICTEGKYLHKNIIFITKNWIINKKILTIC